MDLLILIIRLALAAIFVTAGVAKFADLRGSEKAFKDFGVPAGLALPSSIALSVFEITVAAAFLFTRSSWFASLGAGALLALFIGQMVYQRAKGNAPDCHCFGQLHSEPVSMKSIARNAVFLALAAVPIVSGPTGQGLAVQSVTLEMMPTLLGTLIVVMLGGALLYLRKLIIGQGELKKRIELLALFEPGERPLDNEHAVDLQVALPIGSHIPDFELRSTTGEIVSLSSIKAAGRPVLFFFVSPTCEPCRVLLPNFIEWRQTLSDRLDVIFVSSGASAENQKKFAELENAPILLDAERKFAISVGGRWTPTALFIDANGKVASHVAAGDQAIVDLVTKIEEADLDEPFTYFPGVNHNGRGLKIGMAAPDFSLPDLDGRTVTKQDLLGKKTLVTFWSPTCPHCTSFLDVLREWESTQSNGGPRLMLISDGDADQHKDLGLQAPVLLDEGYRIAAKLGMSGTPSAVLIDETGTIITETGIGAANIRALIGRHKNGSN